MEDWHFLQDDNRIPLVKQLFILFILSFLSLAHQNHLPIIVSTSDEVDWSIQEGDWLVWNVDDITYVKNTTPPFDLLMPHLYQTSFEIPITSIDDILRVFVNETTSTSFMLIIYLKDFAMGDYLWPTGFFDYLAPFYPLSWDWEGQIIDNGSYAESWIDGDLVYFIFDLFAYEDTGTIPKDSSDYVYLSQFCWNTTTGILQSWNRTYIFEGVGGTIKLSFLGVFDSDPYVPQDAFDPSPFILFLWTLGIILICVLGIYLLRHK